MIVREETWGKIPLLHIVKEQLSEQVVPVAIFHHGFTSAKEHNLHFAYNLAKQGIRVLLPDAHLHGARTENLDEVALGLRFWETVFTSIEELPFIREELIRRKLLTTAKIGVGGTSMGGITTLGALTAYKWIDAAMVMMGAPGFVEFATSQIEGLEREGIEIPLTKDEKQLFFQQLAALDITKNPSVLNERPIYFWHGKKDLLVPYEPTWSFYELIKKNYKDVPERLTFTTDCRAGHVISRPAMLESVNWLARHLNE